MSKSITKVEDAQFNDLLSYVQSQASDIKPVENCKLCQSKHKAEAHKTFDNTRNCAAVLRFLKDKGEDISYPSVNNHINNHYKAIQENQSVQELARKLDRWKLNPADATMYDRYVKMLDREATVLTAKCADLDVVEERKTMETVMKLLQTIVLVKGELRKMEGEKREVKIFVDSLNRIIAVKLEDCKSPEVKQALKEVLDQLAKDVDLANPTAGLREES